MDLDGSQHGNLCQPGRQDNGHPFISFATRRKPPSCVQFPLVLPYTVFLCRHSLLRTPTGPNPQWAETGGDDQSPPPTTHLASGLPACLAVVGPSLGGWQSGIEVAPVLNWPGCSVAPPHMLPLSRPSLSWVAGGTGGNFGLGSGALGSIGSVSRPSHQPPTFFLLFCICCLFPTEKINRGRPKR